MQNNILFLGSGFVSLPCLSQLLKRPENHVTVACRHLSTAQQLVAGLANCTPIQLDVNDTALFESYVEKSDLVISLIPYTLHVLVIEAAIKFKKHVVTTSYISPAMAALHQKAIDAGITVFNEIGVDPGIDHLYAIKTINEVQQLGGKVTSFLSYCGGLPAPECSNNPLGYKFSWSSRGVLLALRNDAKYWLNGKIIEVEGKDLMDEAREISIYPAFAFEGYPNRDSTPYTTRYNMPGCQTLIRGTLRYKGFPKFVKVLVNLGFLNDESVSYLASSSESITWGAVMQQITGAASTAEAHLIESAVLKGKINPDDKEIIIAGLKWLGLFSTTPVTLKGNLLDTLCATLEQKMQYEEGERDMVMLQHRFECEYPSGKKETRTSTGLWYGDNEATAMARTVGVPCGVTAQLVLDGIISERGVLAPMKWDVCELILNALVKEGISMVDAIL